MQSNTKSHDDCPHGTGHHADRAECYYHNIVLPESSSKRRRLYGISSSFDLQAFMDASVQAGLESVVPPDKTEHLLEDCVAQALAAPSWKGYEDVSSAEESNDSVPLLLAKRCVSHLERRFIECTLQLHSCIAVCRTIHAYGITSVMQGM